METVLEKHLKKKKKSGGGHWSCHSNHMMFFLSHCQFIVCFNLLLEGSHRHVGEHFHCDATGRRDILHNHRQTATQIQLGELQIHNQEDPWVVVTPTNSLAQHHSPDLPFCVVLFRQVDRQHRFLSSQSGHVLGGGLSVACFDGPGELHAQLLYKQRGSGQRRPIRSMFGWEGDETRRHSPVAGSEAALHGSMAATVWFCLASDSYVLMFATVTREKRRQYQPIGVFVLAQPNIKTQRVYQLHTFITQKRLHVTDMTWHNQAIPNPNLFTLENVHSSV